MLKTINFDGSGGGQWSHFQGLESTSKCDLLYENI